MIHGDAGDKARPVEKCTIETKPFSRRGMAVGGEEESESASFLQRAMASRSYDRGRIEPAGRENVLR